MAKHVDASKIDRATRKLIELFSVHLQKGGFYLPTKNSKVLDDVLKAASTKKERLEWKDLIRDVNERLRHQRLGVFQGGLPDLFRCCQICSDARLGVFQGVIEVVPK